MAPLFSFKLAGLHEDIAARKSVVSIEELKTQIAKLQPPSDVRGLLDQPGMQLIGELPSNAQEMELLEPQVLRKSLDIYSQAGLRLVAGHVQSDVVAGNTLPEAWIQDHSALPFWARDLVIDPYQLYELRALGAAMVTLYAAALSEHQLASLIERAFKLGLEPVAEVASIAQAKRAVAAGVRLIAVDTSLLAAPPTQQGAHSLPDWQQTMAGIFGKTVQVIATAEMPTVGDLIELRHLGFAAVLVHHSITKQNDAAVQLRRLVAAGVHPAFHSPIPVRED